MIKKRQDGGILLDFKYRPSGEAEIGGKHCEWPEGFILTYVPFEQTKVFKRPVDSAVVDEIDKTLENVHWGSLISLELRGRYIISVTVEADPLAEL